MLQPRESRGIFSQHHEEEMERRQAWQALVDAAAKATELGFDQTSGRVLSDAAKQWASRNGYVQAVGSAAPVRGTGGRQLRSGQVMPFGRSKGVPIEEVEASDLEWVLGRVRESVDDPEKQRWRVANAQLADALQKELATR